MNLILVCKIAVRSEREYCSFATFAPNRGTLIKEHVHESVARVRIAVLGDHFCRRRMADGIGAACSVMLLLVGAAAWTRVVRVDIVGTEV